MNAFENLLMLSLIGMIVVSEAKSEQPTTNPDLVTISRSQLEDLQQGTTLGAAEMGQARPINATTMELIKAAEGWRARAYDDPSGYCTIGFGHLIALRRCSTIDLAKIGFDEDLSEKKGELILFQDTASARVAVSNLTKVDLNDDQFGALVSFTFNVGKGNFGKSTLLKIVNGNGFDEVPKELRRWSSSAGKVLPGLLLRRDCEGNLFMSALKIGASGKIDMRNCIALGAAADIANPIDVEKGE